MLSKSQFETFRLFGNWKIDPVVLCQVVSHKIVEKLVFVVDPSLNYFKKLQKLSGIHHSDTEHGKTLAGQSKDRSRSHCITQFRG